MYFFKQKSHASGETSSNRELNQCSCNEIRLDKVSTKESDIIEGWFMIFVSRRGNLLALSKHWLEWASCLNWVLAWKARSSQAVQERGGTEINKEGKQTQNKK